MASLLVEIFIVSVPAVFAEISVREINAARLSIEDYHSLIDVRNLDEYEGTTAAANCTIGKKDAKGCNYGHVPGARWMPQFYLCGGTTPGTACSDDKQSVADVRLLLGNIPPPSRWRSELSKCTSMRFAFICHSGVRSLVAAKRYAKLLRDTYGNQSPLGTNYSFEVLSIAGGTRAWFNAGKPTEFGPQPELPELCSDMELELQL